MVETENNVQHTIVIDNASVLVEIVGSSNRNLKIIAAKTGATLDLRGNELSVSGKAAAVALTVTILDQLSQLVRKGFDLGEEEVHRGVAILQRDRNASLTNIFLDSIPLAGGKRNVAPKSPNQQRYIHAMRDNDVVLGIGPAGTGKTYLAMAMAVHFLYKKLIKRIVLTRPAVEAGEKLGFLPGDIAEKVNPYLRPLYDALHDLVPMETVQRWMSGGVVEVAPLAFMRGRSLNDSFIILDEAQNTTTEQMKMFLTRMGFGSKTVVNGDVTQIDLPPGQMSGLVQAERVLQGVEGIGRCRFQEEDVVRHPLVRRIVQAYEKAEMKRNGATAIETEKPLEESDG